MADADYFALPVKSALGHQLHGDARHRPHWRIHRAGNLGSDPRVAETAAACLHSQRRIASNILTAYLGPKTGPKVLAGKIRRGTGEEITAVLWASDLRGFTERSDRLAGTQVIAMLNVLFDAQAKAIAGHGGEILKFIGDGLLAIFPIEHPSVAGVAARNALAAAMQAVEAARGLTSDPSLVDEPPLEIVVALPIGTAINGNIGAANRLDFTVIGPAVNLVSRIEATAKTLADRHQRRFRGGPMANRCIRSAVMSFGGSQHPTICLHRFCPPSAYRAQWLNSFASGG